MAKRSIKQTKRRQQLHRNILITLIIILILLVIVGIGIYKNRATHKCEEEAAAQKTEQQIKTESTSSVDTADKNTADTGADSNASQKKEETAEERLARVKKEAETKRYPKDVIELLTKNPETVDFVEDYEAKKDNPVAENIGSDYVEGQIPKLIQWDERWGYKKYGTSLVAASGCGPTCLSMVFIKLTGNSAITPAVVADYGNQMNAVDDENNTLWTFMSQAAAKWGVNCSEGLLTEEQVAAELSAGHPIICSVGPGDFTKVGHFIVLASYNNGQVEVRDPFNKERTEKTWNYKDIESQIVEMWTYSK